MSPVSRLTGHQADREAQRSPAPVRSRPLSPRSTPARRREGSARLRLMRAIMRSETRTRIHWKSLRRVTHNLSYTLRDPAEIYTLRDPAEIAASGRTLVEPAAPSRESVSPRRLACRAGFLRSFARTLTAGSLSDKLSPPQGSHGPAAGTDPVLISGHQSESSCPPCATHRARSYPVGGVTIMNIENAIGAIGSAGLRVAISMRNVPALRSPRSKIE
jgi:hypothetical protein